MPDAPRKHRPTCGPARDGRPSAARRGYDAHWRRLRAAYLADYPLCQDCQDRGAIVAAKHVDHVLALTKGGSHDPSNLRSLCHSCHSRKTVACDGGLGRHIVGGV